VRVETVLAEILDGRIEARELAENCVVLGAARAVNHK
jgi:hypothetical protein